MGDVFQVELERERSVREILLVALRVYRCCPPLFAVLALGVIAPYDLAILAATGYGPLAGGDYGNEGIYLLVLLLNGALVTPLVSALHMHAVVLVGEGRRPRLGAVALLGVRVLPVVAAAEIMASGGIALGFLALVVPGIVLAMRWAVVAQVAALEHGGWSAALGRSARLTHGRYVHVFGLLIATGALGLGVRVAARAIPAGSTSGVASVTVGILVDSLLASFSALTLAVLYFDLRARPPIPSRPRARREHPHVRDLD